jgi:hypothetical protein
MDAEWTDEELEATVLVYRDMQQLERSRTPYRKSQFYAELAGRPLARSVSAYEFRLRNISAVLDKEGQEWIPGLAPAANVGSDTGGRLLHLLNKHPLSDEQAEVAGYKHKIPAMRAFLVRVAQKRETVTYEELANAFGFYRPALRHALNILSSDARNLDEPLITAIVVNKAEKTASKGFAQTFNVDDKVERERLFDYWAPKSVPAVIDRPEDDLETKAAKFASVEVRPEQAAFRRAVFLAYGGKCVVSGCSIKCALDAAHKRGRDWRQGHNQASDGWLLRKDLHALYDAGHLDIDDARRPVFKEPSALEHYQHLANVSV